MRPTNIIRPYWHRTRRLTITLLCAWFILTFGVLFFARELASLYFFGWPVSFYMAAQGLTLTYVAILGIFSLYSHKSHRSHSSHRSHHIENPNKNSSKDSS